MQTILGAGGAIGRLLAEELVLKNEKVRLVSRHPSTFGGAEWRAGDITDPVVVDRAVDGSFVVYLTVGLEYKYKVWRNLWPLIMQNVINSCKKHGAKLVFFDNAYMYDPAYLNRLTEETPVKPVSKKGRVRAQIADMLLNEMQQGSLQAMIVRAADFYGPGVSTSVMQETVQKKLQAGKKALWLGNPEVVHTMTYTPDAAKATALLAASPDAFDQIWHLPTHHALLSGKQWVELFAKEMGKPARFFKLSGKAIRLFGLFVPFFRELGEMMYQFDSDYVFHSQKFTDRFPEFQITCPSEGVRRVVSEANDK